MRRDMRFIWFIILKVAMPKAYAHIHLSIIFLLFGNMLNVEKPFIPIRDTRRKKK